MIPNAFFWAIIYEIQAVLDDYERNYNYPVTMWVWVWMEFRITVNYPAYMLEQLDFVACAADASL